jgi:hypothetical protein
VDGGACCRRDPDGFGTEEEFLRRPLDGSPGAKIKFKLGDTFQIFNVEAAKQPEAAEVERLAATELLGLCKVLREAGKQADAALSMLGEAAVDRP